MTNDKDSIIESNTPAPIVPTAEAVKAQAEAEKAEKAPEVDNKTAEMLRKINKVSQTVEQLASVVQNLAQPRVTAPEPTESEDDEVYMTKAEYKAWKAAEAQTTIKARQGEVWTGTVLKTFPELDKGSEEHDATFYKLTDQYFTLNFAGDPDGPLKAAKLAAVELGKTDFLTRKVLDDNTRRERILTEGGTTAKQGKKESGGLSKMNASRLKNYLKIDAKELDAFIKANPDRYGKK